MRVFISKAKELREVFGFVEQSSVDIHAFLLKQLTFGSEVTLSVVVLHAVSSKDRLKS
jgi:hypothetical protein